MEVGDEFCGVILAGGRGSRMFPFSDEYPKPLLPICNKSLIVRHIETMKSLGIRDIFVLIGHKGFKITMALGDGSNFGVRLHYVEQQTVLGIAHAVGRMEGAVDRPFMMILGDIFFVPGDLNQMLDLYREQQGGAILAVKEEPDPEAIKKNYSVTLSDDGRVNRVIEKPRHTTNQLKGVGLYLFDLTVFDAVRRTPRTAMRDEYEITDAIQVMIDDGVPVRVANSILSDINVTTPFDLLRCNLIEADAMSKSCLVGENTVIHPDAVLERCVIGSNVAIRNPVTVRDSVIFDGTLVEADRDFSGFILTPEAAVNCNYHPDGVQTND